MGVMKQTCRNRTRTLGIKRSVVSFAPFGDDEMKLNAYHCRSWGVAEASTWGSSVRATRNPLPMERYRTLYL